MRKSKDDLTYNRFNSIKTLYYSDRLKQIAETGLTNPVIWHIYPANRCPHNCNFCIMKKDRETRHELSKNTLLKAVKEAKENGAEAIHFSGGGEPLLHANITDALSLTKELGMKAVVSTNGYFLTNKVAELADTVRVSLNAGTPETHKRIMGANTWDLILRAIGSSEYKEKIGLGYVLTHENWQEVYKFCELANNLGVNFVHIRPAYLPEFDKRIQELLPIVKGMTDQAINDFPELNIYSVKEKFDGFWTERKYEKCLATPMNAVLKANGKFIPCQDRLDLEFGDLNTQSFKEIWGGEEHKAILNSINCNDCPRCVMTKINEYIENIFVNNNCLKEII